MGVTASNHPEIYESICHVVSLGKGIANIFGRATSASNRLRRHFRVDD